MNIKARRWYKPALAIVTASLLTLTTACSYFGGSKGASDNANPVPVQQASANEPGWKADTSPITFDWYMNFSWYTGSDWGKDPTSQYITKKTGVSLNFIVPAGNENEKLNTMIASGKLPDFITLGWSEDAVKKMIEGKLVLPLNELAKEYDPYFFKVTDPAKLAWYTQPDGNVYGYPNASSSPADFAKYGENYVSNQVFVVRKDMYEALGKPDMRTPEGFLNALKMAREKFPQVNGQPLIPLGLHEFTENGNYSLESYLQNFLALPMEKDGKLYDRTTDPEYVRWLKTLRQANQEGLLAKDIFIDKRAQMEEKIAQGRYFAMLYQRSDFNTQQNALYASDPDSVYIAVDGPSNAQLDQPVLSGPVISGWTLTLISKDVKDKARAIRFLEYMISEEGQKDMYMGEEGVTYDMVDGKPQFKPEALKTLNTDRSAFDTKYGASHKYWMQMNTNITDQWKPESVEPFKQMEDWTKGKTVSRSEFDQLNPTGNSPEGIINTKITQLWGKTLPQLLLASSDAEFDQIFQDYLSKREEYGLAKVQAYQQAEYEKNLTKLKAQ
ncbi:type 2 periplasmic-binding domain-containing protein [Paenibacillus wulumuqiensis]|uniref:extracellular solute-binding protein n=1 Tax=Paenibacillus wulumuqiensis TaxID=1567107 RepID=UPI000619B164|nr:extracellular solute-binding protein [Paenibacillus wulumuqiensis]